MNLRVPASLKVTVPLLLLGFAAALSGVNLGYHVPQAERVAEEVIARVRSLIRRAHGVASPRIAFGDMVLDTRIMQVSRDGVPVFQKSQLGRHAKPGEIVALIEAAGR